jgi:hypothetical protein
MIIMKSTFIAEIVRWGIRQNPFEGKLPRNTDIVVEKLGVLFPDVTIEVDDLRKFVSETIDQVPEIRDWNLSQIELEAGVNVDDENRRGFVFVSRYSQPSPEYDFIDIDALKQNITRCLKQEVAEYA